MLDHRDFAERSLFTPANLLREARRQKSIIKRPIPRVCLLDPDGDIVRHLTRTGRATRNRSWACYHTEMYDCRLGRNEMGIVPNAVGSPFAVLVAEEMFASGCTLLLSVTSAGRISPRRSLPRFLVISRALRDEGTSDRYLERDASCGLAAGLLASISASVERSPVSLGLGASWTTDAPFRETSSAIRRVRRLGADCVEMEAAALYAFAAARKRDVVCIAHVTNTMARSKGDFEKGAEGGSIDSLALVEFLLLALGRRRALRRRP